MSEITKQTILSMIRHTLTLGAGWLIGSGKLDEPGSQEIIGAIMAIIGVVWARFDKTSKVTQ